MEEPTMVLKVLLLVLPKMDRVWVLVDHAVEGGRSMTTEDSG